MPFKSLTIPKEFAKGGTGLMGQGPGSLFGLLTDILVAIVQLQSTKFDVLAGADGSGEGGTDITLTGAAAGDLLHKVINLTDNTVVTGATLGAGVLNVTTNLASKQLLVIWSDVTA